MSDVLFRSESKKDSKNIVPIYTISDISRSLGHSLRFHSLRVHFQVRMWKSFDSCHEDPLEWGWKKVNDQFLPIMTGKDPAPENLLKIIRCKCKLSSKNACGPNLCSCKKSGLRCVAACEECRGQSCFNVDEPLVEDDDDVNDGNILELLQDML